MKKTLLLLVCLGTLMAACATHPLDREDEGLAIENPKIGFRGYRLALQDGYTATSLEMAKSDPVLQDWIKRRADYFQRVRVDPNITDQVFLMKGHRVVWFAVEEIHTPVPFSRLAPDRRKRLLRFATDEFRQRASRVGETVAPLTFERIGTRELVRTELSDDLFVEEMSVAVMGGLNEIYHFTGVAFEGEGVLLERDILDLIQNLSF